MQVKFIQYYLQRVKVKKNLQKKSLLKNPLLKVASQRNNCQRRIPTDLRDTTEELKTRKAKSLHLNQINGNTLKS